MKTASNFFRVLTKIRRNFFPTVFCLGLLTTVVFAENLEHIGKQLPNNSAKSLNNEPSATFQKIRVEHNLIVQGKKGMKIFVDFKVYDMKGMDGFLAIYFQKLDGTPLKDRNGKYRTTNGNVATYEEISPGYQSTVYEDFDLFMPYEELDLPSGNHEIKMDIDVVTDDGELVSHLTFYNLTCSNSGCIEGKNPRATVDKVWVDYDVTQGGRKGMRIHLKANIFDMNGREGYFAFYIQKEDGTPVTTTNKTFQSIDRERSGQLAVYYSIKPGFANTLYEDANVFLPYDEIKLPKGVYDLQIDVDLMDKNGILIQHLYLHDFWFEI